MMSMQGVPSSLIARNESWVRQQANALARRLPSNIEKADLIQAGLIAVAQAALGFEWEGDRDTDEAKDAFVRYARLRVKGAMLDELRQMDQLSRADRRKVKAIQIARQRWLAIHATTPSPAELSALCGIGVDEIGRLEQAALAAQTQSLSEDPDGEGPAAPEPATPRDEVEARVDTAIVMRRLESYFAALPERDRQVIDAYLGVGMTPVELASLLRITPSSVSQLYRIVCSRIARHFGQPDHRALDHIGGAATQRFEALVSLREAALAAAPNAPAWGGMIEDALTLPSERFGTVLETTRISVDGATRWG